MLQEAIARLGERVRSAKGPGEGVDLTPGCAYGVRYSQALEDLKREVSELKSRINGLIFMVAGAVVLNLAARFLVG